MREARVAGCRDSSTAPVRRCGKPSETEMQNLKCAGRARRSSPWMAQSLRSGVSPAAEGRPYRKALRASGPVDPTYLVALEGLRRLLPEPTPSPRLWAASPGATPVKLCEHTIRVLKQPSKPELSTLLGTGSFYFAPTPLTLSPKVAAPPTR